MDKLRVLVALGTRPEAIKLAPVVAALSRHPMMEPKVCLSGQHRELVSSLIDYFQIPVDWQLDAMRPDSNLAGLTARCLAGLDGVMAECRPAIVVGQGDTTTALTASLAAFFRQLPFVHVEAGLRTADLARPFPEEFHRRAISITAALHCAPTPRAADQLLREGVCPAAVHVTGNTVVDALLWTRERERRRHSMGPPRFHFLQNRRLVLITSHRRETHGAGLERLCAAIDALAGRFPLVQFVYPVHPNPQVREPVQRLLGELENVHLLPPLEYPEFVWLMDRCDLILTDSGGIQEEAPSLGKPVLVLRDRTERPEAVECGCAQLVGTDMAAIVERTSALLSDGVEYARRQTHENPFGDGRAAERIVQLIVERFGAAPTATGAE